MLVQCIKSASEISDIGYFSRISIFDWYLNLIFSKTKPSRNFVILDFHFIFSHRIYLTQVDHELWTPCIYEMIYNDTYAQILLSTDFYF